MKRVFLDTETTGLAPGQIAQLSLIIEEDGKELVTKNYFFDIDYITSGAEEVCGRGVDFYKEASGGRVFKDDMAEILELLSDATLIAHNLKFDENFISTEFWRQSIVFKPKDRLCTMEFFKDKCKILNRFGKIKNPKLEELIDYFKIDKDKVNAYTKQLFGEGNNVGFHDARYDTTSMYVAFKIYCDILHNTKDWTNVFCKEV